MPDGTIVLRPNEFSQPDYSVIYKTWTDESARLGRIFSNDGLVGGAAVPNCLQTPARPSRNGREIRVERSCATRPVRSTRSVRNTRKTGRNNSVKQANARSP